MRALHRLTITLLLAMGPALQAATAPAPEPQAMMQALARANSAVVGIEVRAAEGALSAETLGRERAGTGVVIGADGLVLTIGYLVLEADRVQLTTQDGRSHPARLVAYDLATGFGLVQSLLPLRDVVPAPLGAVETLAAGQRLLAITGGEDGDIANVQVVSRRPFSGYWEYHIDGALFTTPPVPNHSGAGLFNHRGELVGIGSLFVMSTMGGERRLPGNMFVPVDLLRPVLEEMRTTGTTRASRRPWLGLKIGAELGYGDSYGRTKDQTCRVYDQAGAEIDGEFSACGLPFFLVFDTLSAWLRGEGLSLERIAVWATGLDARGVALAVLLYHEIHHRGQMTVLMRQAGLAADSFLATRKDLTRGVKAKLREWLDAEGGLRQKAGCLAFVHGG